MPYIAVFYRHYCRIWHKDGGGDGVGMRHSANNDAILTLIYASLVSNDGSIKHDITSLQDNDESRNRLV
jgi:hypothetical protein